MTQSIPFEKQRILRCLRYAFTKCGNTTWKMCMIKIQKQIIKQTKNEQDTVEESLEENEIIFNESKRRKAICV